MSGFGAEWLALREPADAESRSSDLVRKLRSRLGSHEPLRVVDLGAGTGANLRYLAPLLGGSQEWLLVDNDEALLAAWRGSVARWAEPRRANVTADPAGLRVTGSGFDCSVRSRALDLAAGLDALDLPEGCLVTASALLDLVSAAWLEALATRCRAAAASLLFALTYDGRIEAAPGHRDDALALALFNRHQRGDKGFGPALGPDAPESARATLASLGYAVTATTSDWRLTPAAARLEAELLSGWHDAAVELAPEHRERLAAWRHAHRREIEAGRAQLTVGHSDIAAWLEP